MRARLITIGVMGLLLSSIGFADIKRTASGKPDLSGFYDSGTLTPLNRPEALGDKQFMTPAEAEQYKTLSGLLARMLRKSVIPIVRHRQRAATVSRPMVLAAWADTTPLGGSRQ